MTGNNWLISREDFFLQAKSVIRASESRRARHIARFKMACIASATLVPLGILVVASGWLDSIIVRSEAALLMLVICGLCAAGILYIFMKYRGSETGLIPRNYSLQDAIYSSLLKLLGNFEYAPQAAPLTRDLQFASIIPRSEIRQAEDIITGVMSDSLVKIVETRIDREEGERKRLFQGLLVVIDICESKVKLRRNFAGRTVLVADTQKADVKSRLDGLAGLGHMKRVDLPTAALEDSLELFSEAPREAEALLTEAFLQPLVALNTKLQGLREQHQHGDDKLARRFEAMSTRISQTLLPLSEMEKIEGAKENEAKWLDKDITLSQGGEAINGSLQLELIADKCIISLPCPFDLFETNSLFEEALDLEDLDLLYDVVATIGGVCAALDAYFTALNPAGDTAK